MTVSHTWIFVSHSSADLPNVRKVRNYLEEKGTSPLLFHLLSLKNPEEFWPLIEREITERNFFLYCESANAEASDWVRRERETVKAAGRLQPKRIGSIRVDQSDLDYAALAQLVTQTRIFPSYSYKDAAVVRLFIAALRTAGFSVFDAPDSVAPATDWGEASIEELAAAARDGWVAVFISKTSLASEWVRREIAMSASAGARLVPVLIEPIPMQSLPHEISSLQIFDATRDPARAPVALVNALLKR